MKIEVRQMRADDAEAMKLLSQQPGIFLIHSTNTSKHTAVLKSKGHTAFVALQGKGYWKTTDGKGKTMGL